MFEGRRQLIIYRAFYGPDVTTRRAATPRRGCVGCSFVADQVAHPAHLNARDTTLAFVSRAPQAEIQGLKERMGWQLIPWYTLTDEFDADFGVDEWHGHNAFIRDGDDGSTAPTSSTPAATRQLGSTWSYLDITALGRQEEWEDSPEGYPQTPPYQWWNYHDAYGAGGVIAAHVAGLPLEELPPPARRPGAALLLARAWLSAAPAPPPRAGR